jgi:hypothetical protein
VTVLADGYAGFAMARYSASNGDGLSNRWPPSACRASVLARIGRRRLPLVARYAIGALLASPPTPGLPVAMWLVDHLRIRIIVAVRSARAASVR